jgi:multidrug efflux pump subunit AcrA (membrane-fusion protein)
MKNKNILITVIAIVIIVAAGFGGMKYLANQKVDPPTKPIEIQDKYVKALKVKNEDIPVKVVAYGRVGTAQPLDLTAEVSGRIESGTVPLKAGQAFRKGDVLFVIEQRTALLNLKSQKSTLFNLIGGILPDMRIDYSDNYEQWQNYFQNFDLEGDLPELPEPTTLKEKTFLASKNIFTNYYTIKGEEERLKKAIVRAPYSGSITEVLMEVGSFSNLNSRIAKIIKTDQLEIDLPVELNQLKWIKTGSEVILSDEQGQSWKGKVKRMSSYVNPNTQSISVYIGIENNPKASVYDGLYLRAEILGTPASNVMEVPRGALFEGNKLFVIENEQLKIRAIQIEKFNEETVLVSGLKDGDQVVPEPVINARENMDVKIL